MWETNVGASDFFSPAAHGTAWFCCFLAILPLWLKIKIVQGFFFVVVSVWLVWFLLLLFVCFFNRLQRIPNSSSGQTASSCDTMHSSLSMDFFLHYLQLHQDLTFFFFKPKGIFSVLISSSIFWQIKQLSVSVKSCIINTDKGVFPIL